MLSKYKYKDIVWVDLESPTREEVASVSEEFSIPALVEEEMLIVSTHSKVEVYSNLVYLTLHFPKVASGASKAIDQEVDFIIGKNFLITVHDGFLEPIYEFTKSFEAEAMLEKRLDMDHAGLLFFHLVKNLYRSTRSQLHNLNSSLTEIENYIFSGKEAYMVKRISDLNRTLLNFKQSLRFHEQVIHSFELAVKDFFGEKFLYYVSSIMGEYTKTKSILDSHKEVLRELKETNDSLLASKTSSTIKFLTVVTFLISPVTVISNIFVINANFMRLEDPTQYNIVLVGMLITSIIIFIFIKRKKWL